MKDLLEKSDGQGQEEVAAESAAGSAAGPPKNVKKDYKYLFRENNAGSQNLTSAVKKTLNLDVCKVLAEIWQRKVGSNWILMY